MPPDKISRLAVGDPAMPVMVNIYRLSAGAAPGRARRGLPFGTRGGLAASQLFPAGWRVRGQGRSGGRGARAAPARNHRGRRDGSNCMTIGGVRGGGRGAEAAAAAGDGRTSPLEFRIPVKAGPRLIGVTFVQHNEARDEATLRPRMRSRGTQPAIASGDHQRTVRCQGARRHAQPPAHLRLPAGDRGRRTAVRQADSFDAGAPGLPASGRRMRMSNDLLPFYTAGETEARFRSSAFRRRSNGFWSARSSCSASSAIRPTPRPEPSYRISDLELASRLSFFLWSSIPDDELLNVGRAGKAEGAGSSRTAGPAHAGRSAFRIAW